jgi:branched-chain amino acid transport system ATP-binding protein
MAEPLLEVRRLTKRYGELTPVNQVSFTIAKDEVVGLIGPNGAGKSTLIRLITGVLTPTSGEVFFEGKNLGKSSISARVNMGLAATFQIVRPFRRLPTISNAILSCLSPRSRRNGEWVQTIEERAMNALEFCGIAHLAREDASSLSHGDLKRLELARALATEPSLLLLDEPFGGSNETETSMLAGSLKRLSRGGRFGRLHSNPVAMFVVEHKLSELMRLVDRVLVLDLGEIIADGPPEEVVRNPAVVEAYLGRSASEGGNSVRTLVPTDPGSNI